MVQRSRSFGFAETVLKHFAVRVARLRMTHRAGEVDVNRECLPQPERLLDHPVCLIIVVRMNQR
jgi:hypothetical protein